MAVTRPLDYREEGKDAKTMSDAQTYFDALRHIDHDFMTTNELRRNSQKEWGLPYEEALEMAYDNLKDVAKRAVKGKRRPK